MDQGWMSVSIAYLMQCLVILDTVLVKKVGSVTHARSFEASAIRSARNA